MRFATSALAGAASALFVAACIVVDDRSASSSSSRSSRQERGLRASASLEAKSGSSLKGSATFTETPQGVLIDLFVESASPGWHAVHIHEVGDCSAADGTSAGGHFNPNEVPHGSPHLPEHHAGDLGNMIIADDGSGRHVILMPELTVADGPSSVRGRSIIVHAGADDLTTQPTGDAGGRIGCGVIR